MCKVDVNLTLGIVDSNNFYLTIRISDIKRLMITYTYTIKGPTERERETIFTLYKRIRSMSKF